jgi:dTDP-4-dehydrorhamnose reductase
LLKVVGETLVSAICHNYAIVRIAGVYGVNWSYPRQEQTTAGVGFGWLANYYVHRMRQGLPVYVLTEHVNIRANPSLASDVAEVLLAAALEGRQGTLHGCGRDGVSRLELAHAVAEEFDFDPRLVRAANARQMEARRRKGKMPAPRDSRLQVADSELRLNRTNAGLSEGLSEYRRQLESLERR